MMALRIKGELNEEDPELQNTVESYLSTLNKVNIMAPSNPDNMVYRNEREFEATCFTLEENGISNAKYLTEFEWWNRILYLKKKAEELNRKQQQPQQ
jgi:hypothetical protein